VTFVLLLERETGRAAVAGPLRVTVHVEFPAAWKELGAHASELTWTGATAVTLTIAVLLRPFRVAVTVTD
jgi:hypothetical protein